jgi:Na+:H+ antiporter, NhaA family
MLRKIGKGILTPLQLIIRDSRSLGILLSLCAITSIFMANSGWGSHYISFWQQTFHFPMELILPHTLLDWVNDFLMAIFFFMVGMEIKRELLVGELSDFKNAILPIFAAIGGMVVPALIYFLVCRGTPYTGGWGIPMATDIAFSLGIASLLGKRVPVSLKIFLTALAIIDDLGAIAMIAIFYGGAIHWIYLLYSLLIITALFLLAKVRKRFPVFQFILGIILWYLIFNSGIHATVAGVLFAFTIPMDQLSKFEHRLHIPVNFIILPIFALANTAIIIPGNIFEALQHPLNIAITLGLAAGKPIGIVGFCLLLVKLKWGTLPKNINWLQLTGVAMLAGIGFTMSIFIATLAFIETATQDLAKIGVLLGSLISIIAGSIILLSFSKKLTSQK